jgi:adenylate cyclase
MLPLKPKDTKSSKQYYPDQTLTALNGGERSVNFSVNTMFDDEETGRVRGALVVMEDISQEKRLKNTFYRYMTQEVAEQLLSSGETELGGKREEVSVLFSDIRSYTTITEQMQAEEVVEMLNQYFELMVDAVFEYKGTLDKYIGDAIMAVFGSPLYLEDHAWMSVQAAVEMRHRLIQFNSKRLQQFMDKNGCEPCTPEEICMTILNIGIGINSDTVISGNIGSSKRMELTSIGDGVNLGSRLEGATKQYGCDIIISESTYAYCQDRVWVTELDRIKVKGKNNAISIYELVDLRSNRFRQLSKKLWRSTIAAVNIISIASLPVRCGVW